MVKGTAACRPGIKLFKLPGGKLDLSTAKNEGTGFATMADTLTQITQDASDLRLVYGE